MNPVWPIAYSAEVVHPVTGGLLSSYVVALEAWRRGLSVTLLAGKFRRVRVEGANGRVVTFTASKPSLTTTSALRTAKDKHLTAVALRKAGIRAPRSKRINSGTDDIARVIRLAGSIGYPVVLKPVDGGGGAGVFANIRDSNKLQEYYTHLVEDLGYEDLVLESHICSTQEIRVLVIGGQVAAAVLRIPANITGDGKSSIDELIEDKNRERQENPFLSAGIIRRDREVMDHVRGAGLTLDSVIPDGRDLSLRGKVNADSGGDTVDVTEALAPLIRDEAVAAVQAIPGLFVAGVDVLVDGDFSSGAGSVAILELNPTPQIGVNMYPAVGFGQDVPRLWIDKCFPDTSRSRILGEDTLTFPFKRLLRVLDSGMVNAVTVAPVPSSRLPRRSKLVLPGTKRLTVAQERALLAKANSLDVSGSLRHVGGVYELDVAAPDVATERSLLRRVTGWTGEPLTEPTPWVGIVQLGFHIE